MSVSYDHDPESYAPTYANLLEQIFAGGDERGSYKRSAQAITRAAFTGVISSDERSALIDALDGTKKDRHVGVVASMTQPPMDAITQPINPEYEDGWSPTAGIPDEVPERDLDSKERAAGER